MVKIPCDGDDGIRVPYLQACSYAVDDVTQSLHIPGRGNVNNDSDASSKFPWEIIWTKFNGNQLDIRAADTLLDRGVPRMTPLRVYKHGKSPFFLFATRCGVLVRADCVEAGDGHIGVRYLFMQP